MSVPPRAVQLNEANAFLKDHPEVLYVDLLIADMNGVVRGKRIERTSLHKVYEKGINLPASLFALDINGSTVEGSEHRRDDGNPGDEMEAMRFSLDHVDQRDNQRQSGGDG